MNRTLIPNPRSDRIWPIIAMMVGLLIAGCSNETGATATSPQEQLEYVETLPPSNLATTLGCEHLLWPLTEGRSWDYQLNGPTAPEDFTLDLSADDGLLKWHMAEQSNPINCVDGAISSLMPALVAHPELGRSLIGMNPRGALMPSADQLLPLGTPISWDIELDAVGSFQTNDGTTLPVDGGKLVFYRSVIGVSSTTVPAGTFSTVVVKEDAFLDIVVGGQPLIVSTTSTHYYAENVGLIRIEFGEGLLSGPEISESLSPGWTLSLVSARTKP